MSIKHCYDHSLGQEEKRWSSLSFYLLFLGLQKEMNWGMLSPQVSVLCSCSYHSVHVLLWEVNFRSLDFLVVFIDQYENILHFRNTQEIWGRRFGWHFKKTIEGLKWNTWCSVAYLCWERCWQDTGISSEGIILGSIHSFISSPWKKT